MKRLQELLRPQDYQIIAETYGTYSLDWNKVFTFAWELNVEGITNPSAYRRGAIMKEIQNGSFLKLSTTKDDSKKHKTYLTKLWNDLRAKNVRVLEKSQIQIEVIEQYMYDKDVPAEEINELNHQISNYIKEGETTEKFYEFIKKSMLVKKYNIDIEESESLAEEQFQEWKELEKEWEKIFDDK